MPGTAPRMAQPSSCETSLLPMQEIDERMGRAVQEFDHACTPRAMGGAAMRGRGTTRERHVEVSEVCNNRTCGGDHCCVATLSRIARLPDRSVAMKDERDMNV